MRLQEFEDSEHTRCWAIDHFSFSPPNFFSIRVNCTILSGYNQKHRWCSEMHRYREGVNNQCTQSYVESQSNHILWKRQSKSQSRFFCQFSETNQDLSISIVFWLQRTRQSVSAS